MQSLHKVDSDYSVIKTKQKFSKYFQLATVDQKKPISIESERSGKEKFVSKTNVFMVDHKKQVMFYGFDTKGGDSGAPIIQNGKVGGMHIGVSASDNKGIALLLNQSRPYEAIAFNYEKQNPVLARAILWCGTNAQPCAAAILGGLTFAGTALVQAGNIITEYIKSKNGYEFEATKDKLKTCEENKEEMNEVLKNLKEELNTEGASIKVEESDPILISNPGWETQVNDSIRSHSRWGGSGGGARRGRVTITDINIPMHTEFSLGEEAVGALGYLASIALVDAYINQHGSEPTVQEFNSGMNVVLSGKTMTEIAYYAKNRKWKKDELPRQAFCPQIFNCPHEM